MVQTGTSWRGGGGGGSMCTVHCVHCSVVRGEGFEPQPPFQPPISNLIYVQIFTDDIYPGVLYLISSFRSREEKKIAFRSWVRICKLLRSSWIDSKESIPGGLVRQMGLSYRPNRLAESIPGLLKRLKIRAQSPICPPCLMEAPRLSPRTMERTTLRRPSLCAGAGTGGTSPPASQKVEASLRKKGIGWLTVKRLWLRGCQPATLQGKSHLFIPFLGIARPQSKFPHSCVCEWFIYCIPRIGPHIFLQQNRQTDSGGI